MALRTYRKVDFSGGLQTATTRIIRKPNELVGTKNVEFKSFIGGVTRRLGYTKVGDTLRANKNALGAFVHRYATGSRLYMASNNAGDTQAVLSYLTGVTWTDLITTLAANTKVQAMNHLGEAYVFGATAAGVYMDPVNVDSTPAYSTTRNLFKAPRAKYIAEFQGSLFAINAQVNLPAGYTTLADRAYKSSPPTGAITFVKGDQTGVLTQLAVDSVRYIKVGQVLDIYTARTDTRLYQNITVTAVDKLNNKFSFASAINFATTDVNTTTDVITLSSTTTLPTGTPVQFTTTTTLPAGLSLATTYYVINISGTTIKLATTLANALAGTPVVDITSQGTGTHTVSIVVTVANRDEIWGAGRKNLLSVYWNTDYPTTETADFLRIPQGKDDAPEFTGWASTTARLFLFTRNSFYKFDGSNFVPVSTTIGSLSHEAIKVIGQWVIFPHYTGLWGYNDTTGQLQLLSRGVKDWFKAIPLANWDSASAGVIDNVYKLSVGTGAVYKGTTYSQNLRVVYDFDSNNFALEFHTRNMRYQFLQTYSDQIKLHFADDTGKLFVDETGNLDDTITIPFEIEIGRDNYTIDEVKNYLSCYVYTESPRGAIVQYQLDGGDWQTLGELKDDVQLLKFPDNAPSRGRDINFKISQNDDGDPISVIMLACNFNTEAQGYDV